VNLSALWIILANGWMQNPVGYILRNGRAEMTDFAALVFNGTGWQIFLHTVLSGFALAAFFVMGVSAYHLLRKNEVPLFTASLKTAAAFGLAAALLLVVTGDMRGVDVAKTQPAKLAAMESHWETQTGAPMTLLAWPDEKNARNAVEGLKIPSGLSWLAFHRPDAEVKGLRDFPPGERPPVLLTFLSFRIMVAIGGLIVLLALGAWLFARKGTIAAKPLLLKLLLFAIPLPYIAIQLGWIVAEVGRQPWLVYGVFKTADGVSKSISSGQVLMSLLGFAVVYGLLGAVDIYLLTKFARKGPEEAKR
jgi:cytochrome d ubiquinol oxidase subunit I